MQSRVILAWLMIFMPVGMKAQQLQPPVALENNAVDDTPLSPPVTLNGQAGSMAFRSETPMQSYLTGGIAFIGSYTDNALLTSTSRLNNFSYLVEPHLVWSEITPRFALNLGLSGGVIFNNNLVDQNQAAENVDLDAAWRLTEHVSFRLDDTFSNTTGMSSSIGILPPGAGIGVVQQSNNTLLVPPAQRTVSNQSLAELTDQVGRNTLIGVRGTYSLSDYPRSSQSVQFGPLYNARAYTAEAFYDLKFATWQWFGVTARGQRFETRPGIATTDVGSLLMYYSVEPTSAIMLTFFAGPEYSNTSQSAVLAGIGQNRLGRLWASSEGATLSWKASRSSANLSFVRQLNDGGGLASAVTLQSVSANFRQQLSSHQNEVQLGVMDSKSDALLLPQSIKSLSASVVFQQRLARSFVMQVGYSWQRQDLPSSGTPVDYNRTWFSVSYDFLRPLGR
jgi:hypothetical protein